jgi:hypothetical protein
VKAGAAGCWPGGKARNGSSADAVPAILQSPHTSRLASTDMTSRQRIDVPSFIVSGLTMDATSIDIE